MLVSVLITVMQASSICYGIVEVLAVGLTVIMVLAMVNLFLVKINYLKEMIQFK